MSMVRMTAFRFLFLSIWLSCVVVIVDADCKSIANCVSCHQGQGPSWCTQCEDRYYMNNPYTCSKCPSTCVKCLSQDNCLACVKGYFKNSCNFQCDPNCVQTECFQYNGICVHGCNGGYYRAGSRCNKCSIQNCEECSAQYHCTRCSNGYNLWSSDSSSSCYVGCPTGTWGDTCQYKCSSSCPYSRCNESNGHCYSCSKYTYGQTCQFRCSDTCKDNTGTNVCYRQTEQCIHGCKTGYFGAYCENVLKVDGQWGQWSAYGPCSVTCGLGSSLRTRSCDNPAPQNGGQPCRGNNMGETKCQMSYCPVDGQWGEWSYTHCSVTCGFGTRTRSRSCDQPAPKYGGQLCNGKNIEMTTCSFSNCPVDGQWGQWSEPRNCSVTCGQGSGFRSRTCDKPEPQNGGQFCNRSDIEITNCSLVDCPKNGRTGTSDAISGSDDIATVVGGAVGGVVLFVVLCVVLAAVCIFWRRNKKQNAKDGIEMIYKNETTTTAVAHEFENNSYNTVQKQEGSGQTSNEYQNEEYVYSIPHKDKKKGSVGEKKSKDKSKSNGTTEAPHVPRVPPKLPNYMEDDDLEEINESNMSEMDNTDGKIPEQSDTYYNTAGIIKHNIPIENLANSVGWKSEDEFIKEYQRLTDGLSRDYTAAVKNGNKYRNRYKKVFPYDATRVKLKGGMSDYINASFVDGFQQQKAYIACSGPTETTMDKYALFWTMVWQQKVEKIVMLTRLMEGEKMKCGNYWPESTSESYGDITVHRISEINYAEFSIRNFEIVKGSKRRRICQAHYIAWPDRGVPDDLTSLVEFRHKVVAIPTTLSGPMIIHCSAGIGRTGTYIALDMLIKEGTAQKSVDVYGCVNGIRGQRVNLVQNVVQYKFLHHALVHELTLPSQLLSSEQLAWFVTKEGRTDLRQQFGQLKTVIDKTSNKEAESIKRNRNLEIKNRKDADVPGDRHRIKLIFKKPGSTDFINATFIDGYMKLRQFIVAQTPLPETLVDFIGLIMQENVACIVSMDPDSPKVTSVGNYLPQLNQTLKVGIYEINCIKSESLASYVMKTLEVSKRHEREIGKKTVQHLQQTLWQKN